MTISSVRLGYAFLSFLLLTFSLSASAAVTIDNGVVGDGFWSVEVQNAGDSSIGRIDPVGSIGPTDVIFSLRTHYDNGLDGVNGNLSANTSSPAALTNPGEVTSSGSFPGPNGTINWTAVATIAPGSPLYQLQFDFSSSTPFGATRIINYLDEDVLGISNNLGVVLGTDGADDFLLLTVNSTEDVGVSHGAGYFTASNMTYAGWHMTDCCGAPSVYSVDPGQVTDLSPTTDPRFPADPVYGPDDITSSFAFDFDTTATTASVTFVLGGSADASRPGGPAALSVPIPLLSKEGLLGLMLLLLSVGFIVLRKQTHRG